MEKRLKVNAVRAHLGESKAVKAGWVDSKRKCQSVCPGQDDPTIAERPLLKLLELPQIWFGLTQEVPRHHGDPAGTHREKSISQCAD